jgi:hypothetical protein
MEHPHWNTAFDVLHIMAVQQYQQNGTGYQMLLKFAIKMEEIVIFFRNHNPE